MVWVWMVSGIWWALAMNRRRPPKPAAASSGHTLPTAPPGKDTTSHEADQNEQASSTAKDLATLLKAQAADMGEPLLLSRGDVLVREGDESDRIYIVMSGEIAVSIRNEAGDDVTVASIGAGKVIGEMTLFGESKRSATCRASSACVELIAISNDKALQIIDQDPEVRRGLVMELTQRSRSLLQYINEFSHLTQLISTGDYSSVQAHINLTNSSGDDSFKAARSAFSTMLTRIREREAELQSKIQDLTIQIDQSRAAKEIQSITEDSIFQSLQQNSAALRAKMRE